MKTAAKARKKKVTLSLDREVYDKIVLKQGERGIGRFISETLRPILTKEDDLARGYRLMGKDVARASEVAAWDRAEAEVSLPELEKETWRF